MKDLLRQMGRAAVLAILLGMTLAPQSALAVQPDEILDDPVLEQRARDLSKGLRCLVCRNENIDDSNAELARDLRLLVRERLVAGDTDDEAIDFITDRYGEYVLLNPRTGGSNWVLWAAGPVMLITGLGIGLIYLRRRSRATETALSQDEEARLKEILDR
ncbi:cytochrome c-type biogenesis protein CcmH [Pseudooceanicola nitratireducens]|jgi:cytochrome c-type biogenesis protein CcmH|uniref:Cytochrome c-type biogenesis protein n=2 Tax=Pseudooceanicola nitratireducens TaxID=517719 RepID=A0A1I1M6N3_9RHOB|nr:cytochrome c-type biogenesis protein CcmH [Pseudooceanicola nitratireducens]SFC80885.1 cytochrome c-type biogenesis protein CcmH [Pseudooceanicola nitratireducens]